MVLLFPSQWIWKATTSWRTEFALPCQNCIRSYLQYEVACFNQYTWAQLWICKICTKYARFHAARQSGTATCQQMQDCRPCMSHSTDFLIALRNTTPNMKSYHFNRRNRRWTSVPLVPQSALCPCLSPMLRIIITDKLTMNPKMGLDPFGGAAWAWNM